jgi:hypothetical protein
VARGSGAPVRGVAGPVARRTAVTDPLPRALAGPAPGGPVGVGLLSGGLPGGRLFGPGPVVGAGTAPAAGFAPASPAGSGPAVSGPVGSGAATAASWAPAAPRSARAVPPGGAGPVSVTVVSRGSAGSRGSVTAGSRGAVTAASRGPATAAGRARGVPGASALRPALGPSGTGSPVSGRAITAPVQRLANAPVAGPSVSAPVSAATLPVLGASSAPIGAPDPSGAVSTTPPPPSPVAAARAKPTATPRERWEAAVAARPLERPRPLPAAFHPMAREITGRAHAPRFTTGPATREALAAAGALGATTGAVVHLPATPTAAPSSMQVLAHELTHARQPVRRPRFFLGGLTAHLDDDERGALAAGRRMLGGAVPTGPTVGSGLPGSLPVAPGGVPGPGGLPGLPGAGSLPGAGGLPSLPGAGSLPSLGGLPGLPNVPSLPTAASMAGLPGVSDLAGLPGQAGAAARNVADEASTVGAGLVERLPVGGGVGAVADMAQTTARQTVLAAMPGGQLPNFSGAAGDATSWAQSAAGGLAGQAESAAGDLAGGAMGAVSGMAGDASGWAQGALGQVQGAAGGLEAGAQNLAGQAQGLVGQAQNAVGGAAAALTGGAGAAGAAGVDPDKIVEMVEERLLREIERRGGRWAGVF